MLNMPQIRVCKVNLRGLLRKYEKFVCSWKKSSKILEPYTYGYGQCSGVVEYNGQERILEMYKLSEFL